MISHTIRQLRNFLTELPADLQGYSAQDTIQTLLDSWEDALFDGNTENLVKDVDIVIEHLQAFKKKALSELPVKNGGLGGISLEAWKSLLTAQGGQLFEEAGTFSFNYGTAKHDGYTSEEEALSEAALLYLLDGSLEKKAKRIAKEHKWSEAELQHALANLEKTYTNECVIPLPNQRELRIPHTSQRKSYARIVQENFELHYWDSSDNLAQVINNLTGYHKDA